MGIIAYDCQFAVPSTEQCSEHEEVETCEVNTTFQALHHIHSVWRMLEE
jgi:hypothetical protein